MRSWLIISALIIGEAISPGIEIDIYFSIIIIIFGAVGMSIDLYEVFIKK